MLYINKYFDPFWRCVMKFKLLNFGTFQFKLQDSVHQLN